MPATDFLQVVAFTEGLLNDPDRRRSASAQRKSPSTAANRIRIERAKMRRKIHALPRKKGCRKLAEYVADPPRELTTIKIGVLVDWIWGVGKHRARRFLRANTITRPDAALDELTPQERRGLVLALREGI